MMMARAHFLILAVLASLRATAALREANFETDQQAPSKTPPQRTEATAPARRATTAGAASDLQLGGNETMHQLRLGIYPEDAQCSKHTGGTCGYRGCYSDRGPAQCVKSSSGRVCDCPHNWCAWEGACYPVDGHCTRKTGGTCKKLGCNLGRGHTTCVNGECLCKRGFCAHDGACWPVTATGGTCKHFNCKAHQGGKCDLQTKMCMCPEGQVWHRKKCRAFPFHDDNEDDY